MIVYEGSKACGQLVLWVLSQVNYCSVGCYNSFRKRGKIKKIPKKQKLAKQLLKLVKELEDNISLYTTQCNQMIDHIIQSTDNELKQFSDNWNH